MNYMAKNERRKKIIEVTAYVLMVASAIPLSIWGLLRIPPNAHESRLYIYVVETPIFRFITDDRVAALLAVFILAGITLYSLKGRLCK